MTHAHADHTHGIDDLRPISWRCGDVSISMSTRRRPKRCGANSVTSSRRRPAAPIRRWLEERRIRAGEPIVVEGAGGPIEAIPFDLEHGDISALGFRFGGLAYTPDLNGVPEASRRWLEGLDVWIVDALRYAPHPSHWSLDDALAWNRTDAPAPRGADQSPHRPRLRDAAQAPAARASSRPTTACASKDFEGPCRRAALDRDRPQSDLGTDAPAAARRGARKPRETP